jgi:hypothetical protein
MKTTSQKKRSKPKARRPAALPKRKKKPRVTYGRIGPGKFSDPIAEKLWDLTMDSRQDDQCGDVSENGMWFGLLTNTRIPGAANAIVTEDDQGFVDYQTYYTPKKAREIFDGICADLE